MQLERRKTIIEEHSEEKYLRMIDDLSDSRKIQLTQEVIIPMFLRQAIRKLQKELVQN